MSHELLVQAILEETYGVKICGAHPEPVHYDEQECPCCKMEKETCEPQSEG
jgi:hypothetical protein